MGLPGQIAIRKKTLCTEYKDVELRIQAATVGEDGEPTEIRIFAWRRWPIILLRGIPLSGHDDPFLMTQFLTTELDTIQGAGHFARRVGLSVCLEPRKGHKAASRLFPQACVFPGSFPR